MDESRRPGRSIRTMQSPLSQFIQQAEQLRPYVEHDASKTSSYSSAQSDMSSRGRTSSRQDQIPARQSSAKQYPPNSFRMDEDPDATPRKTYEPGSPLHENDYSLLQQVKAPRNPNSARRISNPASNRAAAMSQSTSVADSTCSDNPDSGRGPSSTCAVSTSEATNWSGHSVPTTRRRRRSSLQRIKDAANQIVDGMLDGAEKVVHSINTRIDESVSRRQRRGSQHPSDRPSTSTTTSSKEPSEAKRPTNPKITTHTLPSATEVYSQKTYFTKCPHVSPPAHAPLDQTPRTETLEPDLLRYPTDKQKSHLDDRLIRPTALQTIPVLDGRCAPCDLQQRRNLETQVLRGWKAKHETFARRLRALKRKSTIESISVIYALGDKLEEVREARDRDVVAVWEGFRARWGVCPVEIVEGNNKEDEGGSGDEKEAEGEQQQPQKDKKRKQWKRQDSASSSATRGITGTTGTGFMRNGKHGGPMDDIREPGRMRLSWSRDGGNEGAKKMPSVPKGYKVGQDLRWTTEEKFLLEA